MAVTGLGVLSGIGADRASFWESLTNGRHGFREITLADTSDLQYRMGAEVSGVAIEDRFDPGARELLDRFAMLFLLAAREAIADSGLEESDFRDAAIVTGSSLGGQSTEDELFRALYQTDAGESRPSPSPRPWRTPARAICRWRLAAKDRAFTLATACASSTHAIGLAFWMVSQGVVERAIAGGSEAPFSRGTSRPGTACARSLRISLGPSRSAAKAWSSAREEAR